MRRIYSAIFAVIFVVSLLITKPVFADGFIIPDRPIMEQLVIRYHHVDVQITNQLAVTTMEQTFSTPTIGQLKVFIHSPSRRMLASLPLSYRLMGMRWPENYWMHTSQDSC